MYSSKDLRRLVLPLIIEQILAVTIGIADTVMVSSAGEAAVSGISLIDSINVLLINLFTAIATGGAIVTTQYIGSRQAEKARNSAAQLEVSVLLIALGMMAVCVVLRRPLIRLIFGSIAEDVMASADIYFLISAVSYPFLAVYNAGAALFRSMSNSKTPMYISTFMNVLNVAGNALLIYGFAMGAAGEALASLFSRAVGAVIITALLFNRKRAIHLGALVHYKADKEMIGRIFRLGLPNGVENSMFQFGKLLVASIVSSFGTAAIAANAVANNIVSLQVIPSAAIGTAMMTVVGTCRGAGRMDEVKKYTKKLMILSYVAIEVMIVFTLLIGKPVISFYELSEETAGLAWSMFFVHSVAAVLVWPLAFTMPNALRAVGDVKYTMVVSIVFVFLFRVGFSWLLAKTLGWGAVAIWIAMAIDWVARGLFFTVRFLRGKWQKIQVI